ncbi:hypothetical protein QCA50_013256 [Cerrena zonata]|uniref:F-box domain-containing protein n=1 Tax=Cerrena zonata TaxID=2478898 RepID=A0AAW0G2Z3_9APHY
MPTNIQDTQNLISAYVNDIDIKSAEALAIFHQLPFTLYGTLPWLPTEVCEEIIDWVAAAYDITKYSWGIQKTLYACALVCRAWVHCAQMHLFTNIQVRPKYLCRLHSSLQSAGHILSSIRTLKIGYDQKVPISSFLVSHRLQNLSTLVIHGLDLAQEHTLLVRAPLFHTVQHLHLFGLKACKVSQLIRFINSFHSLISLELWFFFKILEHNGQILPRPSHISSYSLTSLELRLIPGVSRLLDWCLKAGSFFAHIQKLTLCCYGHADKSEFISCFRGVGALLQNCSATIEELTLRMWEVPMVNEVSDLFYLESFPKLQTLSYQLYGDYVLFKYAERQFSAVSSKSCIVEVQLNIYIDKYETARDIFNSIDSTLTSDKFSSLLKVKLHKEISFDYFPKLQQQKKQKLEVGPWNDDSIIILKSQAKVDRE